MKQKLVTKQVEKDLLKAPLYSTDGQKDKKVIVKFFTPWSSWTWYVFEAEKKENGDWTFFGMVENEMGSEMGYFTLSELQSIKGSFGLSVERDIYVRNEPYKKGL